MQLKDVLGYFEERFDVRFVGSPSVLSRNRYGEINLKLGEVPFGAALSALHDITGLRFEVKEYGILLTGGGGGWGGGWVGDGGSLLQFWESEQRAQEKTK